MIELLRWIGEDTTGNRFACALLGFSAFVAGISILVFWIGHAIVKIVYAFRGE